MEAGIIETVVRVTCKQFCIVITGKLKIHRNILSLFRYLLVLRGFLR